MKLNLELNIDWLDEEMSLDEAVRQNVIDSIVSKIQAKVEEQVQKNAEDLISQTIVDKINAKTEELFDDFMNKEVILHDKYGDVVNSYENVTEVIKNRFDNFLTQKVDEDGKIASNNSYGKTYQRLEYVIDKQLKSFAEKFTTDAVKKVSAEIQEHVQSGLTQKLGAELMKVLKVEKMLKISN